MGQSISRAEAYNLIKNDINVPISFDHCWSERDSSNTINSFVAVVTHKWLQALVTHGKIVRDNDLEKLSKDDNLLEEIFNSAFDCSKISCVKIQIHAIKKGLDLYLDSPIHFDATMLDLIGMVNKKERKLFSSYTTRFKDESEESIDQKERYDWKRIQSILKDIYNINIVKLNHNCSQVTSKPKVNIGHLLPVDAVLESDRAVYVIERLPSHSLSDILLYSPAVIHKNHAAVMFLFYQLLHCFSEMTKQGFRFNEMLTLDDVYLLDNSLWIGLSPFLSFKSYVEQRKSVEKQPLVKIYDGVKTNLKIPIKLQQDLSEYTKAWCDGNISNFDYLVILNVLAGRKFGDALNHPVFPWVTDFSCHFGGFRDLTKTKFRLNKGDRQLDATFSAALGSIGSAVSVQHHVSDVLSDITYYIYRARITTQNMLCAHVRSRWVPNEYPSSIGRMYNWTPDECIPEFFYDPEVFKTIHDDLDDLRLPAWMETPEEFVQYHYQMLESKYVSQHLHHWIDLIFGFKLSGLASKKEKNVHLSLVDDHLDFKNYGIVQLFATPHPKKSQLANKNDCFPSVSHASEMHSRDVSASWEYVDLTTSMKKYKEDMLLTLDQDDMSPRKTTKSIHNNGNSIDDDVPVPNVYDVTVDIADLNFLKNLEDTEATLLHELSIKGCNKDGIGSYMFRSAFPNQVDATIKSTVDDNTKLLACLLMEIVLHKDLRIRTNVPTLNQRVEEDVNFLNSSQHITSSVKYFLKDLLELQIEDDDESISPAVPTVGFISTKVQFPSYFKKVHSFLLLFYEKIRPYVLYPINNEEKLKLSNIIEKCATDFEMLLNELNYDGVNLLLLYLVPLFENNMVRIPMFLYFFSPLSISLGPARSKLVFLKEVQKLFDSITISEEVALLQQAFLTKALSSLGLDTFLQYIFKLVLDVLVANDIGSFSQQRCRKSSSLSTSSSTIEYKNESLISYEVSPCVNPEVDSVSSLNLGNLFMDNEEMFVLSQEYTLSFTSESSPTTTTSIINNGMNPTPLLSPSTVLIDSTMLTTQNKQPILSFQEVQSGIDSMIEINATNDSLENFTNASLNTTLHQSSESSSLRDNDEEINVTSNKKQAPFTLLLNNDRQLSLDEGEEVLEEVPVDENFEKITKKTSISAYQSVVDSVKWLTPWLGPSLATEHVVKPLLRRLSKVFLEFDSSTTPGKAIDLLIQKTSPIIECLTEVALVYGDAVVLQLFLPKVSHVIENATISSSVSITLSSNLVTNVQLLMKAIEFLQPESILTHVEEFSVEFFQPLIRLLSTVKPFTTGSIIKEFLACKLIDTLGIFCKKLNREVAQDIMAPLLQQFFSCFDGIYALKTDETGKKQVTRKYTLLCQANTNKESTERKKTSVESSFSGFDEVDSDAFSSRSDRITSSITIDDVLNDEYGKHDDEKFADIYNTFSPSLAYHAYVLFCRVVGTHYIEKTLYNSDLVWHLFTKHDERLTFSNATNQNEYLNSNDTTDGPPAGNVIQTECKWAKPWQFSPEESESQRSSWQHIDGKWLEHWKNSQDLDQHQSFFSDLKLQTYAGHSSAIRDFYVPNNEHYFLSASRDKTVKLWLLKNHGNGTAHLGCSHTYDQHTKAIFAVQGIESKRLVASCDGEVWDPVTGKTICEFDAGRGNSFTCIRTLPAPSTCLAVATTEGSIRLYDVRQEKFAEEWKLSPQVLSSGMVRSMCCNEEGTWLASGLSSGVTVVLDVHAGVLKCQTRMHDSEITQMVAAVDYGFISASVDYNLRLWHEDGNVSHIAKTSNETIHTLVYNRQQLIWATTNNKLCIHQAGKVTSSHSYRIGQDSFKGNLSKLAVLPVNRLYLCGADNGNVVLYA